MAGIQLIQGTTTYNAAGASHPAPISVSANVLCYLSIVGTPAPISYTWRLLVPAGDAVTVISSQTSHSPTFTPAIVGGAYSVQFDDGAGNTYILDIQAATTGLSMSYAIYHGQVVNIVDKGAISPGDATANTAAILAAAAQINAAGGGVVMTPGGTFDVIMPSLRFLNYANVTFKGEGKYASLWRDPQAMASSPGSSNPGGPNAFATLADCTRCGFRDLGFQGANVWSQARLNTGYTILARKGIYFQWVSAGHQDCFVEDCYFTNIEGEVVFADGNPAGVSRNLQWNRNHIYRCQSNALNTSGNAASFLGVNCNDNWIDSPGQSALQLEGTNAQFCRNTIQMSGGYTTAADVVILDGVETALMHDNIISGFVIPTSARNLVTVGGLSATPNSRSSIRRNTFRACSLLYAAGNKNAYVAVSSSAGALTNFDVEDNWFIECLGTTGDASALVAVRAVGANAISGKIGNNRFLGNGVGNSLTSGVVIDSTVPGGNGITIGPNDFDSSYTTPYNFAVAPLSDQTYVSGSKMWDPPNVNSGAETTTTVTVSGAALGDIVAVGFSISLAGMKLTGYVSSSNTVTVVLRNDTGGALDLGSGTLRARCFKS